MNKILKKAFIYSKMSLLFMILGAAVLYIAGKPLADYALSYMSMIINKGAPGYLNQGELIEAIAGDSETLDMDEILTPALNTQYGTIYCEQIGLAAPLYYGDNNYSLQNGAGQYELSGLPGEGKPILVGGHDGTFFAPLEDVGEGDIITVKTTYGKYEYQVSEIRIADKDDAPAYDLTLDQEQLILYTCYPFGQLIGEREQRLFVYCDLQSDAAQN